MKIIYCHHAQRDKENRKQNVNPQDDNITLLGREDARIFAKMLNDKDIIINKIYTSPYFRCLETAKIINENNNTKINFEPRFNEYNKTVETWKECQQRIIDAINKIVNENDNDDIILCVTSGVNLTAFICWAYGIKPNNNNPFPGVISCSPIIFDYEK